MVRVGNLLSAIYGHNQGKWLINDNFFSLISSEMWISLIIFYNLWRKCLAPFLLNSNCSSIFLVQWKWRNKKKIFRLSEARLRDKSWIFYCLTVEYGEGNKGNDKNTFQDEILCNFKRSASVRSVNKHKKLLHANFEFCFLLKLFFLRQMPQLLLLMCVHIYASKTRGLFTFACLFPSLFNHSLTVDIVDGD